MSKYIKYEEHRDGCYDMYWRYYDKNGVEINAGDIVLLNAGTRFERLEKVYATDNGELGTDATNHKWIESGRAVACEYGIYPLTGDDLCDSIVQKQLDK